MPGAALARIRGGLAVSGFLFDPGPPLPATWKHVAGASGRSAGRWVHRDGWTVRRPYRASYEVRGPLGEPIPAPSGGAYWPSLPAILAWVAEREGQRLMF